MNITKLETSIGGKTLTLETGKLAKQANSVVATLGETVILATVVVGKTARDIDYLPLKVDYDEKYYAAGVIRTSPYMKRETRPATHATLVGRFIDRSIRPLFPKEFHNEVQLILTVLSYDKVNSPDILAAIAGNAALAISEAPFDGPVGMCRVGMLNDELVVNPNHESIREINDLNMIVSSVDDRIIMLDSSSNELKEEKLLEAIKLGHETNQKIIKIINDLQAKVGKEKVIVEKKEKDEELYNKVKTLTEKDIDPIYGKMDKITRDNFIDELKDKIVEELTSELEDEGEIAEKTSEIAEYFNLCTKKILQNNILEHGKRVGGRGVDEIRPIYIETGLLPRTHGSSLFQRGETQALGVVTLSGPGNKLRTESMEGEGTEKYFHHYNFPPFSVGDISTRRFTGNRELGHGALAEKAMIPVLPQGEDYPYVIRAVSEILESNGSSSMASTCCTSLAMMDAGIPLSKHVSGIAMGVMVNTDLSEEDRNYIVITDLADLEDFGGFMDFKVTGTSDGVTAVQVDMKLRGIPMHVVENAFTKSKDGRLRILDLMIQAVPAPKPMSKYAPKIVTIKIHTDMIRNVIGKGGETINGIIDQTGVEIDISDDGIVSVTSADAESSDEACEIIRNLTRVLKVGEIIEGKVTRLMDFGAIVELKPGSDGLCHISELADHHVKNVTDVCKVGDTMKVKILEISPQGKISLSKKKAV